MVKIKTREVDKETIKTKGRTLMPSQRIRKGSSKFKRGIDENDETTEQSINEYSATRFEAATRSSLARAKNVIERSTSKFASAIKERCSAQKSNVSNYRCSVKTRRIARARAIKEKIEDGAKTLFFSTKALLVSIAGGGTAALVVIIICCFLGSIVYFSDGETFEDYKPVIVSVAESEVGNEGGEKFWKWYGFKERVDWCAIFVSWCAEQCGYLDTEIVPKFSAVDDGAEWFKEKKQWASNDYIPKAGDIVFFDWESDGLLDHVGIVKNIDDEYVYTIEGNSGDVCRELQYQYRDFQIYGYGIIAQVM